MYYMSTHLPESGGQLLVTSLTHNKKTTSSSTNNCLTIRANRALLSDRSNVKYHTFVDI